MSEPKSESELKVKPFPRIPTGIEGLDKLLNGGVLQGGVYLLMGPPGSGKTIIANQMSFHHAQSGGSALYVTLLAEAHGRMLSNLRGMDFFRESAISDFINYIGGYQILEKEGLDGLLRMLRDTVRKFKATLLFIDGVASAEEIASSPLAFKKFVHQLNSVLSTSGCTTFLLSSLDGSISNPEHTMVDGIFSLTMPSGQMRTVREIEIKKFRGSSHLHGAHYFRISDEGISVFPRAESVLGTVSVPKHDLDERKAFDLPKLDRMSGGGVVAGSVTSLLGPAGSGKTTLGSHFLQAGAKRGESSLYFGFYESPARLIAKMDRLGMGFSDYIREGTLEIVWWPRLEYVIDEVIDELLKVVRAKKVKRLFIDGVGGIKAGMFSPDRMHRAMSALANELRSLGVTTLLTEETEIFPKEITATISDLSAVTDNVFVLRQSEINSDLRRFFSILKTRESSGEHMIHEFVLTESGFSIKGAVPDAQALLTGTPLVQRERSRTKEFGANSKPKSKAKAKAAKRR